ncbi:nuclear transport factor 2 family protein [Microvirga terricola]|uniref:Nuclear transport factor 2 family protein n=1 Tax=Microvirga terricola TaxID=2719797 RepID=A0ABX0VA20_9HYPH|nr:nuclear transport factor 2 family protein [Microvirga terricola]NIX75860.1 nuclear transport factor 2 family protein [Microvirga terricola]
MRRQTNLATPLVLAALVATPALAGPAEDLAKARIKSIAAGDLTTVTGAYAEGAALHWVGGPLNGNYAAPGAISGVWSKFFAAQGGQNATIAATSEAANPAGATVTADVTFAGTNKIKVRYVLVYRDGKLVTEIWQVNPAATY